MILSNAEFVDRYKDINDLQLEMLTVGSPAGLLNEALARLEKADKVKGENIFLSELNRASGVLIDNLRERIKELEENCKNNHTIDPTIGGT